MKSISITGTLRESVGSNTAKYVRQEGLVPCVLYGGKDQVHFVVPELQFKKLVYTPEVYTVDLDIAGTTYPAVMRDIQTHPVSDKIMHIDFLLLAADKPVEMEVPVHVSGIAVGVKQGGKLNVKVRKLRVKSLPAFLPDAIKVNVESLEIGKSIRVKDINIENVQILNQPNNIVAAVQITRQVVAEPGAPGAPAAAAAKAK